MLGNFSFGDYFKEEAIEWAWEFLTEWLNLSPDRLYPTIYKDDEESFGIWEKKIGIPQKKIIRLGEDDNFWLMGETGPCGPCSEILYDLGEQFGPDDDPTDPDYNGDRFQEIWNLVFTEFDRQKDGSFLPLPQKNIDTGMGFERLTCVLQEKPNVFDTTIFTPILESIGSFCNHSYGDSPKTDTSFKIIADHIRAVLFALVDQVMPTNTGRGYVIRRLIRRAKRHGRLLGIQKNFLSELSNTVVGMMKDPFPSLNEANVNWAKETLDREEENFSTILDRGTELLETELEKLKESGEKVLSGEIAFQLSDTYGFPFELTEEICEEQGFTSDRAGYEKALLNQKETARKSWKGSGAAGEKVKTDITQHSATEFMGYQFFETESTILKIWDGGEPTDSVEADPDKKVEILLDKTPFYGESGGQIGDQGTLTCKLGSCLVKVIDTQKTPDGYFIHEGIVEEGVLTTGIKMIAKVDSPSREATQQHHTATHLLQAALLKVLGPQVKQAGSWVGPESLRFDFTHGKALTNKEIEQVENLINSWIRKNLKVHSQEKASRKPRLKEPLLSLEKNMARKSE